MSVNARNRNLLLACALLLAAQATFASNPSARLEARSAYDAARGRIVLFGGTTMVDRGTNTSYDLSDTWEWTGDRWVQRYPATTPPGRSGHAMVYDSNRGRTLMFGGKNGKLQLNDTWSYNGTDWTQVNTAAAPSTRYLTGAAFDPIRDRVLLFGGIQVTPDGKTSTKLFDTWEFDGTNWRQVGSSGPTVLKPTLTFDAAGDRVLMVGVDEAEKTVMYAFDRSKNSWEQLKPTTLPTCADDASMTYQEHSRTVLLFGGICASDTAIAGDTWEWDGTDWKAIDTTVDLPRLAGMAMAYDPTRQTTLIYGGILNNSARSSTYLFKGGDWSEVVDVSPKPRSLTATITDPVNKAVWMFGGLDENSYFDDFWKYSNGLWESAPLKDGPASCSGPTGVFDSDRNKVVVLCADSAMYEWDPAGGAWTKLSPKASPPYRVFSSLVYDPVAKKIVVYGGYSGIDYVNETWVYDGSTWTRQKKNPAPARSLASMWFDPVQNKILLYGGIGRRNPEDRIERYADMWSFDYTNGWTEMKNIITPGSRYGAQTAIDPQTGSVLLFGGLRLDINGLQQTQVYADDTWRWNGSSWSKVETSSTAPGRENGDMFFDPSTNRMVLFGGYNGRWMGDVWAFDGAGWSVRSDDLVPPVKVPPRRRTVRF